MKIRTLIVDDEPPARRGLRTLIEQDRSFEVVGECDDGESAVTAIERLAPDVVFLDIQMPGKNGFEVLNALQGKMPHIVFVTAFDRYAIEAFEIQALDYLLKPVNRARMKDSLLRVRERFLESESENLQRKFE
ncbi:MAG TPA: response regulator, partial [Bacteroidota bacterium]